MQKAILYIAIALVALPGAASRAQAARSGAGADTKKTAVKPASKSDSDSEIERNIRTKLAKSKLAADHFTVSVSHGIATVEGSTDVAQHKGVMTRMAKAAGAASVRNNVQVSSAGKAKLAATLAKTRSTASGVSGHTGASASHSKAASSMQVPHATVLPQNSSR